MQSKTRRRLAASGGAFLLFVGILLVRAAMPGKTTEKAPILSDLTIDADNAAKNLGEYIRIDTSIPPGITRDKPPHIDLLIEKYVKPLGLEQRILDGRILLLRWRAPKPAGPPIVFLSHADVVPVADEEKKLWSHPPFSGELADGFIWGRGALDNKASTICELEAIASLSRAGLAPKRDVILLVTPDEELQGTEGSRFFVKEHLDLLEKPIALIDEGSLIVPDQVKGKNLVAIGVGEKQFFTLKLEVDSEAGHSSLPKPSAATTTLARALGRLAAFQLPTKRLPPTEVLLDRMSDHVSFGEKVLLRNRWLFGPVVERVLAQSSTGNAALRSTQVITIQKAGIKDNVIPAHAEAFVNFRLLPRDNRETIIAEIVRVMAEPNVKVSVLSAEEDTPLAPIEGPIWQGLESIYAATIPEAIVAPIVVPGTTDSRFFARAGIATYRIWPFTLDATERQSLHGVNERISMANLAQGIRVYAHLMHAL